MNYIYQALIQPHLYYCNVVRGTCGSTLQNKLQKLQNRAAGLLTYSSYDADADLLLNNLGWKALMVYKSLHLLARDYVCWKFTSRNTNYDLKDSANEINVPLPRMNCKISFIYRGAALWNSLPSNLRQADSLGHFSKLNKICTLRHGIHGKTAF